ncbi:MAG: DinB family protein [Anaerolineales bacterium]|nr:DinB family protein [Anaerolineales bacterium]
MNLQQCILSMKQNADMIRALTWTVDNEQARWKPDPESWSVLEVVNHLLDEEIEDFRTHLDFILHKPVENWPRIGPQDWVRERKYNERDLVDSLEKLQRARQESLAWLEGLHEPNWDVIGQAPFGPISAGDVMASWVAHDLLHIRQLIELRWAYITRQLQPYDVRYAGDW